MTKTNYRAVQIEYSSSVFEKSAVIIMFLTVPEEHFPAQEAEKGFRHDHTAVKYRDTSFR